MSKLIPKNLLNQIPDLYETERSLNPICQIKLFTPDSNFTWYIIEISKEDKSTCYGYVVGFESELGYFSLKEIESIKGALGLSVERDISFKPTALAIIRKSRWSKKSFKNWTKQGLEFLLSLTSKDKRMQYKIKKKLEKLKRS